MVRHGRQLMDLAAASAATPSSPSSSRSAAVVANETPAAGSTEDSFTVEFRDEGTLGLYFSEAANRPQLTVERLADRGLALREPAIQPGCVLVAVNGESLDGLDYQQSLGAIRGASRPLQLTFETGGSSRCAGCQAPPQWCVCSYVDDAADSRSKASGLASDLTNHARDSERWKQVGLTVSTNAAAGAAVGLGLAVLLCRKMRTRSVCLSACTGAGLGHGLTLARSTFEDDTSAHLPTQLSQGPHTGCNTICCVCCV